MAWKTWIRRLRIALTTVAIVVAIGLAAWWFAGHHHKPIEGTGEFEENDSTPPVVNVISPRRDASFEVTVEQLASSEAFQVANLRSRVPGTVARVYRAVGDRVRVGDLLLELDAPELVQEVGQKQAMVEQRKQDLVVAHAKLRDAVATIDVARKTIDQRRAEIGLAEATVTLRRTRLARFETLAARDAINEDLVDEQRRDYQSAQSALESARLAVDRARADLAEKEAAADIARADIKSREAAVEVARKDLNHSEAIASLTRIYSPLDGAVVRRNIEPGMFVSSAATNPTGEPLMIVASADLVTIVAKFPDNVAPFVTRETEALIELDDLPGVTIGGRVSRFAPSIQSNDRTFRVEVDLFNGDPARHQRWLQRTLLAEFSVLACDSPLALAALRDEAYRLTLGYRKGVDDLFPILAVPLSPTQSARQIIPGMSGQMRLVLDRFTDAYVIPSTAIIRRGGKPYLLMVRAGVTELVAVREHVNDFKLAKVSLIVRLPDGKGGFREVLQEPTGEEQIVAARQQEVGVGTSVLPNPTDW